MVGSVVPVGVLVQRGCEVRPRAVRRPVGSRGRAPTGSSGIPDGRVGELRGVPVGAVGVVLVHVVHGVEAERLEADACVRSGRLAPSFVTLLGKQVATRFYRVNN